MKRSIIICIILLGLAAAAVHAQDLDSLMATGDKLFEKGDYRSASLYYEEGLALVTAKAPEETLLIALIHMQLGRCYVMLNNDNTALINYHEALARVKREIVTDREKAARIIFGAYGSILDIYDRLGLSGPMLDVTDEFIGFIEDYRKSPLRRQTLCGNPKRRRIPFYRRAVDPAGTGSGEDLLPAGIGQSDATGCRRYQ